MRYKNLLSLFFLLLTVYQTFGQQAVLSSGSNATGNNGNMSYSIGQAFYQTRSNANNSVAAGVQQGNVVTSTLCSTGLPTGGGSLTNDALVTSQTFQTSCAGKLGTIVFTPTGSIVDDLRGQNVSIGVRLKSSTGTLLGNATIGGASTTDQWFNGATITADFSAVNISLLANTTYSWEVYESTESIPLFLLYWSNNNAYSLGNAFRNGTPIGSDKDYLGWEVNVLGNSTPTLAAIANQATCDGQTISNIALTLGGDLNATLSANDNSQTINPTYTFGGSGADRTLTIATVAGQIGATTVTITATTSTGATATRTFTLEVGKKTTGTACNISQTEGPSAYGFNNSKIIGQTFTPACNGSLSEVKIYLKPTEPASLLNNKTLTLKILNNETNDYSATALAISQPVTIANGATGTLTFTLSSPLTVSSGNTYTFLISFPENFTDEEESIKPSLSYNNPYVGGRGTDNGNFDNNTDFQFDITIGGAAAYTSCNTAPVIAAVATQTTCDNITKTVNLSISDAESNPVTVTATSSNTTLVPNANISYNAGVLSIVPANNQVGTATITLTPNDGFVNGTPVMFTLEVGKLEVGKKVTTPGTWVSSTVAEAQSSVAIAYGNGLYVAIALGGTNLVMTSPDAINWTVRTAAEFNQWIGITYGNGLFVAVARTGTNRVMTSPDGINWTARTAASVNEWRDVTYGNGLFVAVSQNGNNVMTSPDGINWTTRTAFSAYWVSVIYDNGLFVAVSQNNNNVMTSPDGTTWTARTPAENNQWSGITYGNGLFVAVAKSGTNRIMTSPDAITWTARAAPEANSWSKVSYGNGLFMAVSSNGTNRVMNSTDGITWTAQMAAQNNAWEGLCFGNNQFVAVATSGTNRVMSNSVASFTSCNTAPLIAAVATQTTCDNITKTVNLSVSDAESNPVTVTATSSNTTLVPNANISYNAGVLSIVPANNQVGTTTITLTPNDGFVNGTPVMFTLEVGKKVITQGTWIGRTAAEANSWQALTYANGLYVAVAATGTNRVMTSPDAITWTAHTAAQANQWSDISYGNGLYVAVAATGTNRVMTSPDAINWTARTAAQANSWVSVTYGNGLFVAVAQDGTNRVMTSPDGINWTARTAAQANQWTSVTYGNGLFVAVAYNGTNQVMTSPDGINWTARAATEANTWDEVSYGNGVFMAVSLTGTNRVMHSTDGITWTPQMAAQYNGWQAVDFGNNQFVALTYEGTSRVMTNSPTTTYTSCNTAPVIAPVATQTTCDNITKTVNLSISDTESNPVTITATSSNTTLVPNANISYNAGVLSIIPANNQVGTTTITLTPNDGFVNGTPVMFTLEVGKKVVVAATVSDFATGITGGVTGIVQNSTGDIFVSLLSNNKILKFPVGSNTPQDFVTTGLNGPAGLAIDANDNLYIAGFNNNSIQKINAGTTTVNTIATGISLPFSITFKAPDILFVGSALNKIFRLNTSGANVTEFVSSATSPLGIAVKDDDLYVSLTNSNAIVKYANGSNVAAPYSGNNANLSSPRGLVFDAMGNLLVTNNGGIATIAPGGGNPTSYINYNSGGVQAGMIRTALGELITTSISANKMFRITPSNVSYTTCCTIPTITANTPASRCGSGSVTLSATPSAGSIQWFTNETGGTALTTGTAYTISGNNLTINNLTATTTFYAQAVDGSCISATRTAVIATFNALSVPNPSSDSPKCVGTTLTFNSVAGMTTYAWSGPNAFTASTQNPSITNVTAAAQGTYTLTVTNAGGCTASATTAVTINALPVPNPSSDSPKCVGNTLTFNSVAGMTTYAWSGPNAFTANTQNPSITNVTAAANGTYTLTVTNAGGCSASATTAVIINALPAAVNIQPVNPLCERETLYLTASLNDGNSFNTYTYSWAGANAFSATTQSPTINNVSAAAQGTYTLTVTNAGGCTASATTAVTVYSLPAIPTITADNMQICKGSSVILTGTCSTAEVSFRWLAASFLGNQLPFSNTRVITEPGVYRGICESKEGCISDVVSISIELATNCSDKNFITILPEKPAICPGQSISMTASGCSGTLSWNDGTSTQTGTTVSFSPTVTTGYFVSCSTGGTTSFDIVVAKTNLAVASNVSTGKERFKAVETLSSDKKVGNANFTPGASVIYEAGKAIILKPGFVADRFSNFKAEIKTCN